MIPTTIFEIHPIRALLGVEIVKEFERKFYGTFECYVGYTYISFLVMVGFICTARIS